MKKKDAELIQRTLDGDQSAFTALVEKYQKGVHALAWQKIGDFHIAQEITQDAFLRAYQKLGTLKNQNLFSGWLYVIATRLCCEWLRKKRLPMQSLETVDTKEVDQVAYKRYVEEQRETDINEIRRELVRDLLKKLPESERTVMTLHYLGEMTCESISEFLGVSPNTIRSRLSRARNRLKKEEAMIKENLSSFQLPTQMTENIMEEISRLNPVAPSGTKPLVPLAVSAASAVLILLLMGLGTQRLSDFQKPFNLNAQSERTIEISEAQLVIDSPVKPAIRNQVGHTDLTGESNGVGQKPDDPLFAAANADETEVSKAKPQWVQTKGPEGGSVSGLFTTTRGDVYVGTPSGLYRLTDDRSTWKFIYNIKGPPLPLLLPTIFDDEMKWWPIAEWQDTLYLANNQGILTSTDRGETWKALCRYIRGKPVGMVLTDGISEAQSDMIIYLAYANGVFRTDDAGESWTPLPEGLTDRKIKTIAAIENKVFVGTDKGLYRLNGDMWEQLSIDQEEARGKILDIYALAVTENFLYVAAKDVSKNPGIWFEIRPTETGEIRKQGPPWALYRSTNHGDKWDSITPNLQGRFSTYTLKIVAAGEKLMMIGDQKYFYSNDAGETWASLANTGEISRTYVIVMLNETTFYRCGPQGVHRTTDGGESWHQFNAGLVNTYIKNLIAVNGTLYAHTATGLVNSTNGGESWTHVFGDTGYLTRITEYNGNLYVEDYKEGGPQFLRISAEKNRLTRIPDMPLLHKIPKGNVVSPRDEYVLQSILRNFTVTEDAYYVVYHGKLFRWNIGSLNWNDTGAVDVYGAAISSVLNIQDFKPEPHVSSDEFFTFAVSEDVLYVGTHFVVVSEDTIHVGTQNCGRLVQSFDKGNTWNDVTEYLPFSVDKFNAIAITENIVYVATDKGVIVSQSNSGIGWGTLTDAEETPLVMNRLVVHDTTVYGESKQKVYQLDKNTNTWKQGTPEITYPITSLDIDENMLYVGTLSSGVFRFTLDE